MDLVCTRNSCHKQMITTWKDCYDFSMYEMPVHCMQEVNAKLSKMKLQAKAKQAREAKDAKEAKGDKSVSKKELGETSNTDEKVSRMACCNPLIFSQFIVIQHLSIAATSATATSTWDFCDLDNPILMTSVKKQTSLC